MTQHAADEDIIKAMILEELPRRAKGIAQSMGPAPGTERVTGQEELDMWNERDPSVDIMAVYQEALMQGMNDLDAQSAATVKAYPNRGPMLLNAAADDDGRIKYAHRMKRASEGGSYG